jgi:hypothetical protein
MNGRDKEILRIKLISTSDCTKDYKIEAVRDPQTVKCTCTGFLTHGYCKHIRFYHALIQQFFDRTPGFTTKKEGSE